MTHDPDDVYPTVNDYTDLLHTNVMFFKGEMTHTYYYFGSWGVGEDQNDHAKKGTENLIRLTNDHRIFTLNGQSDYTFAGIKQRSYISFCMERETYMKLKSLLFNDSRIYTIVMEDDDTLEHNVSAIEGDRLIVTYDGDDPYSGLYYKDGDRPYVEWEGYDHISAIMRKLVFCDVVCKEFSTQPTADSILLQHCMSLI